MFFSKTLAFTWYGFLRRASGNQQARGNQKWTILNKNTTLNRSKPNIFSYLFLVKNKSDTKDGRKKKTFPSFFFLNEPARKERYLQNFVLSTFWDSQVVIKINSFSILNHDSKETGKFPPNKPNKPRKGSLYKILLFLLAQQEHKIVWFQNTVCLECIKWSKWKSHMGSAEGSTPDWKNVTLF